MDEGQTELSRSRRSYVYESSGSGGKRANKKLFIIVGIVVLLVIIIGSVFSFGNRESTNEPDVTPTPTAIPSPTKEVTPTPEEEEDTTPTPEPTDTPTPKPTVDPIDPSTGLDRSDLSIEIQNGSGVAGAAGGASNVLIGLGYSIASTGNADNFDYENTVIKVSSSSEKFLDLLIDDLGDSYTIGTTSADLSGSSADALVIIGAN